jgi:exosortase
VTATTVSNNTDTDPSGQLEVTQRQAIIAGAVALVCFVGAFFEGFRSQVRWAIEAPSDWGHTLLIPFIAGWFVWLKRDQLRAIPIRPVWSGLVLVILGVVAYAVCTLGPAALQHHNIRGAGVALSLFGLALLVFGWGWMRWLWFPILYAVVFGQRVSERFISVATYKLQDISAKGAYLFLSMFGMDVDLAGNVLTVHGGGQPHMLNVAEACSGMRMLVAFMALGVAMAYVSLPTLWQRVALVLLGGYHAASLVDRLEQGLGIKRLDCGEVDDFGRDSLSGQVVGGLEGLPHEVAGRSDGHVATLEQHVGLADHKGLVGRGEVGHLGASEAQINRAVVVGQGNSRGLGLVVVRGNDDGHARKHLHQPNVFENLVGGAVFAQGEARVRRTDFDVLIRIGDALANLVVHASG